MSAVHPHTVAFFAASTYVWVQYVWHTERGVCLPTVSLWILFVYIEAAIRFKDLKNFHVDLCRPFAAHCIGYPVVTLGFGFKSYVSYKMRLRKQKEVQKENEFYMQLLQQALPQSSRCCRSRRRRRRKQPKGYLIWIPQSSYTTTEVFQPTKTLHNFARDRIPRKRERKGQGCQKTQPWDK